MNPQQFRTLMILQMNTSRRERPVFPILVAQSLRELLVVLVLCLSVSTALVTLVGSGLHLIDHGVSGSLLLRVLPFIVPSMLPFTLPASFLLSLVLVYGRMSADSELTAVKAAGISVTRLMRLPLALGALLSALTFFLTDQVVPWAAGRIEFAVMTHVEEVLARQLSTSGKAEYPPANLRISVADMDGERMIQPVVQHQSGEFDFTLVASTARLEIDAPNQLATLHVRDATVFLAEGDRIGLAGDHSFPITGPVLHSHRPNHFLTLAQIRESMERERLTIRDHRAQLASGTTVSRDYSLGTIRFSQEKLAKMRTEIHNRYALACSCLCFAMFGCPLAAVQARGTLMSGLMFSFLPIVGAYYTITMGMAGQCRNGSLDPAWAMWAGDAVLVVLATWLFYRLNSR